VSLPSPDKREPASSTPPANQRVGIVVVNYNTTEPLCDLLESLRELEKAEYSLVVVDNSSKEESKKDLLGLQKEFQFEVILSETNSGFAAGVNLGLRKHLEDGVELFWLLNPDCKVQPQSLAALLESFKLNGPKNIYGSLVLDGDGGVWSAGGFVDFDKQEVGMHAELSERQTDKMDYLVGCSLFFGKGAIDEIGDLPEEYFLYFEETAWCLRASSLGYELHLVEESKVNHDFDSAKTSSKSHTYLYNRARHLFWLKHSASKSKAYLRVLRELFRALYAYFKCPTDPVAGPTKELFSAHIRACLDAMLGRVSRKFIS